MYTVSVLSPLVFISVYFPADSNPMFVMESSCLTVMKYVVLLFIIIFYFKKTFLLRSHVKSDGFTLKYVFSDLSDNNLTSLPSGLFDGLENLREM